MSDGEPDPFEFPTDFPIKVVGVARDDFAPSIAALLRAHAPDFDPATLDLRASSGANYVSLTATIRATSRAQLDALYRALTAAPGVKFVL